MEVYPTNSTSNLVETYVVKALEACSAYFAYTMVRHKEILFPAHENVLALGAVLILEVGICHSAVTKWTPGGKAIPVLHIDPSRCTPILVFRLESVLWSDDFSFKVGRQGWVIFCESCTRF